MPKTTDKDIEKLIADNPALQKYIDNLVNDHKRGRSKVSDDSSKMSKIDIKKFVLIDEIKKHPLYKVSNRDAKARSMIDEYKDENKSYIKSKNKIIPGQMVMFKYLNPKTLEELQYYDAAPCTIFFNVVNTEEGKRVLGFNLHYFPPQLRYIIINRIFEMYKPVYKKYFESGLNTDMDAFDYKYLIDELNRQNLGFAVRMYIPSLIGDTYIVPPKVWSTAMMTEGWFKKETRAAIMQYFKQDAKSKGKVSVGSHSKGKAAKKKKKK